VLARGPSDLAKEETMKPADIESKAPQPPLRNQRFYQTYGLHQYYTDYISYKNNFYQLHTSQWELAQIAAIAAPNQIQRVLLAGMGFGRELDHLLKIFPNAKIDVLDFNEHFINPAQQIYGETRTAFHQVDLNKGILPFPSDSFDLIVTLNTLEYLDEGGFHDFFAEAARVLRIGGSLFFRLYNASFPFSFLDKRHLRSRTDDMPIVYPRNYESTKNLLSKQLVVKSEIPLGWRINFRFFNFLYSNTLSSLTWEIEKGLCAILPTKFAKSVYFICKKGI